MKEKHLKLIIYSTLIFILSLVSLQLKDDFNVIIGIDGAKVIKIGGGGERYLRPIIPTINGYRDPNHSAFQGKELMGIEIWRSENKKRILFKISAKSQELARKKSEIAKSIILKDEMNEISKYQASGKRFFDTEDQLLRPKQYLVKESIVYKKDKQIKILIFAFLILVIVETCIFGQNQVLGLLKRFLALFDRR